MDAGRAPDQGGSAQDLGDVREDLGSLDRGVRDSAVDLGARDLGAPDVPDSGGAFDLGSEDLGEPLDLGSLDTGGGTDSGAGPVARGVYQYRRIQIPGLSTTELLTRVLLMPGQLWVSARDDRVYIIDRSAETLIRTVQLPLAGADFVEIEDLARAQSGAYVLVAAKAFMGGGSIEGRLYRVSSDGQSVALVSGAASGRSFAAIAHRPLEQEDYILARVEIGSAFQVGIYRYNDITKAFDTLAVEPVSAGCQDMAPVLDGWGGWGLAFSCGLSGGAVGLYDGAVNLGPSVGNTSRLAAHPSGQYALGVSWSAGRLLRYEQGIWSGPSGAPELGSTAVWAIGMSDDGARALISGEFENNAIVLKEVRSGAFSTAEITDVSILNAHLGPWTARAQVVLRDVAWVSGGDCGYLVGGCDSLSCAKGYLISFSVQNGRSCP